MSSPRTQVAEDLLRRVAAAIRAFQLYSKGHPLISRNVEALSAAVRQLHGTQSSVVIGLVGNEIIVDDMPLKGDSHDSLVRRLKQIAVERVTIDTGVSDEELATFVEAITVLEPTSTNEPPAFPVLPHIRVGRVNMAEQSGRAAPDIAGFQQLYKEAVTAAETVWESAKLDAQPDAAAARMMIDGLAEAVSQNRTALLALTTLKNYDNYTFTHMVNVSLLTMGQARALGIDGLLLREFGLAALMHDIGKVRTPLEILNKPDRLTDSEFEIMQRHTVDGAEILRATPGIPTLAPVVAFEHHLRLDGTGYPVGIHRPSLNLGTMLCSIADVYDAMRSQRRYQQSFPTDRILEVLKKNDGHQFNQHLVRRFVQLIGIYPAGNLVRLDTGDTAVVLTTYAPDPHRPHVRVVIDAAGRRLDPGYDINLWEVQPEGRPSSIAAPLDPVDVEIDPLTYLAVA